MTEYAGEIPGLLVAMAVGLIIGFERGWQNQNNGRERAAGSKVEEGMAVTGIRTFALLGLLGGVAARLSTAGSVWVLPAVLLGVAVMLVVGYLQTVRATGDIGATTEVAALLACALGAMAVLGMPLEAVIAAVAVAVLLGFKQEIHGALRKLSRHELTASLQLLVIMLVVLPLLPNEAMGPWDSLNPRVIGWLVLLVAGIGFIGYFAVRILGDRVGLTLTAFLGGLASSTALTLSFSRMSARDRRRQALLGAGIALACGTMAPRVLAEVAIVNRDLFMPLLPGMLLLGAIPLVAMGVILWRFKGGEVEHQPVMSNPLELKSALLIAAALAAVFVMSNAAQDWFGDKGVYGLAILSGIADVDAITLALANQANDGLADTVAARGILLASLTNTLVKAGIVLFVGGWSLARWASSILLLAVAAGATGWLWI
ncbi:MgtC/SapB family protein [Halopseudomonas pelagia]|uniref:MgtC/SapB family protein n=1 Tax=Halopseudomonas pelagia TaxID=553151 RepID=UPI0003A9CEC0|nr:MgtC/SapB family protein [Halopseudomonas pelagia]|tara:strand:- start:8255 stop:9541 length:1287 start_codon:yes stop_codon:yes gene_type:complete